MNTPATLYMVATPIGNLEDISARALRILKEVALIACEDTRRTKILLDRYGIRTPLVSFHQHSQLTKLDWLVDQLASGLDVAVVSDAGTPGINDPGGLLVAKAVERGGISVVPIPGANAAATLLSVSGWPADQYFFAGYLPKKKGRQTLLKTLASLMEKQDIIIVFYESPERIARTLKELVEYWGERNIVIGRELTKQFEEIWRGTLADAATEWGKRSIKGEFVVAVK